MLVLGDELSVAAVAAWLDAVLGERGWTRGISQGAIDTLSAMNDNHREVIRYHIQNPTASTKDIAQALGLSTYITRRAFKQAGIVPPPRQYERQFDYDEIRRLYAEGHSKAAIAQMVGSCHRTVGIAINGSFDAEVYCGNCGARCDSGASMCKTCAPLMQVKINEFGEVWCNSCQNWLPQDRFRPDARRSWRGFAQACRACETRARRERRHADPERENAYYREYRRRRRAAGKT
jgi:AraC-like DNA-binding protein